MTNSKISTVQWLIEKLESELIPTSGPFKVSVRIGSAIIEQALEMEKDQITDAFRAGTTSSFDAGYSPPEDYYEKNFRKK